MRSLGWVLIVTGVLKEEKVGAQTQAGDKKHDHKLRGLEHILPQEKPTMTQLCSWS